MSITPDYMHARVDAVRHRLGVQVCSLYRAMPAHEELEMVATSGLNQEALGALLSYRQGLTGKVARTQAPVVARDIQDHEDYHYVPGSGEERYKSYLGIPLLSEGLLYGVLVVQTEVSKTFFLRDIRELYSTGRDLLDALMLERRKAG
ncbi:protein PtsP [Alcanivorax hongdengensis A-11-3]|uniref:Protein PtsP n=1 Tax=Alcanivorax hongdengensis A-11-3 TaxID=1177179 RepID=L0WD97_9GAMM|nr:GAF domain-containing protein [Alcanivorax hongdengensis]EKF73745.1 protein PtsP [Alcanivorax hongdengensis A-11-3]